MVIDSDFHAQFSDTVWFRARQYADASRAHYLGVNRTGNGGRTERYFFSVSGSEDNEYTVTIRSGSYPGDFRATCNCPYDRERYCKHIGAAIITGLEDGIFSMIGYNGERIGPDHHRDPEGGRRDNTGKEPAPANRRVPGKPQEARDTEEELLFDLSKPPVTTGPNGGNRSTKKNRGRHDDGRHDLLPSTPQLKTAAEASGTYQLLFVVENDNSAYGYRYLTTHDPLFVRPGARYIKKDGSPGRYANYSNTYTFVPFTDSERNLLSWLLDSESKSVPFGYMLAHFLNDPDLRIVMKEHGSYEAISIEQLQAVYVSFEFSGMMGDYAPLFLPRLTFQSEKEETPVPFEAVGYGESGIGLYFYAQTNKTIYYTRKDNLDARRLTRILRNPAPYTVEEISEVQDAIASEFLKVDPPEGKILIKRIKPELALYLERRYGGILAHPAYIYGSRIIDARAANVQLVTDTRVEDTLYVYWRDFGAEDRLEEWFLDLCGEELASFHSFALAMDIPEFLFRYGDACFNEGVQLFLMGEDKPIRRSGSFNIVASSGIDWLDLKIRIDGHDITPGEIDLSRGVVTVDGAYRLIGPETLERLRDLYASAQLGKESMRLSRYDLEAISQIEPLLEAEDDLDLSRIRSALARLEGGFDSKEFHLANGMEGTLRSYQKAGVKWLQFLSEYGFGGILADDMGLGKTIQAITLLAHLAEQGVEGPYLVIAPVSTISNWIREIERFAPRIPAYAHIGPDRPAETGEISSFHGVVVTSYHTLQRDIDLFEPIRWSQVIFDESQALKNPSAKSHKSVRRLKFDRVLAMSGTPVENNIQELWSVMSILNPGLLGTKTDFMRRFRKRIAGGDEEAIETLRAKLRPFLLRRTKEQVAADLPAKEEVSIDVSLSHAERSFYDGLKEKLREEVRGILMSDEPFRAANVILTALSKLRQAAIWPGLVGGPDRSSKIDAVIGKLDEGVSEGHKVLLFSQYVRVLRMLEDRIKKHGWNYRYLDGSVPAAKRKKIIDDFQNDADLHLFLISLKAGGTGINLTEADYVFLIDPWWNPAVESQAIDRTHRIGQTRPVFAYRFLSVNTIEERILELQENKRELVQNVIGEETSMFKALSKDEIIGLFE